MNINLCMGCMKEKTGDGACPYCGFDEKSYQAMPHHLPLGTVLNGKYLIGKVLGEGGFGITYLGLDLNLNIKIAVKEYYPNTLVVRDGNISSVSGCSLTVLSGNSAEQFQQGLEKFVDEARRLAKFWGYAGIVAVKDYFQENRTAYIVMEFAQGKTLKQILKERGGRMDIDELLSMLEPVMVSLEKVHEAGIIHRDISPDNLIVGQDGKVKLLDFGAARDFGKMDDRSLSVILKPGFAPMEQYSSNGHQGPWTDVYALGATIYGAITGQVPTESSERVMGKQLMRPSELGAKVTPQQEHAILKALSLQGTDRQQTMREFMEELKSQEKPNSYETRTTGAETDRQSGQDMHMSKGADTMQHNFGPGAENRESAEQAVRRQQAARNNKFPIVIAAAAILAVVLIAGNGKSNETEVKDTSSGSQGEVTIKLPAQVDLAGNQGGSALEPNDGNQTSDTPTETQPEETQPEEDKKSTDKQAEEEPEDDQKLTSVAGRKVSYWLSTSFIRTYGPSCKCSITSMDEEGISLNVTSGGSGSQALRHMKGIWAKWTSKNSAVYKSGSGHTLSVAFQSNGMLELSEGGINDESLSVRGDYLNRKKADKQECEMVFPFSSSTYLRESQLYGYNQMECKIARNEVYARHGRKFLDEQLQSYFNSCSWYNGYIEPDDFNEVAILSELERDNIKLIVAYEESRGYR